MKSSRTEQQQAMIDRCRNEIRHESGLLIGRLNALLSTQAFLVIAYASSLGSANGAWRQPFTILLPPFLAIVGFVLAWEGRRGLAAARRTIADGQSRIDDLPASEIDGVFRSGAGCNVAMRRRDGDLFAIRTPWIFMASWIWLALLPFYLFLA